MLSNQIEILDSTLREGEQTPGVSFTIKQNKFVQKVLDDKIQPWIEHYGRDKDTKKYFGKEALITDDFGDSPGKFYNFIKIK